MKLQQTIQTIDENQKKISEYGKFDEAILKKINYKLRLDWNYYSNRMEGGTLTREETRSVMVGNIEVKGKPFKDVAEMQGHDKIVLEVLKMSRGEMAISEKRIKEIHTAIMHEDNPENVAKIGKWKTVPNEIINYKNEKILFTQPADVADEIHKLIDGTNAEVEKFLGGKKSKHPLEIAAQFHIDYVSVHPFYDGNGRTARILTNILLLACGYPAIIIKDEHKQTYYQLLGDIQAYGGKADLFYTFIGERISDTQKIVLNALEGKNIEEPDDLEKEIELLSRQMSNETLSKSPKLVYEAFRFVEKEIIQPCQEVLVKFDKLFQENKTFKKVNGQEKKRTVMEFVERIGTIENSKKIYNFDIYEADVYLISYQHTKYGLKNANLDANLSFEVEIDFRAKFYFVSVKVELTTIFEKQYAYGKFPEISETKEVVQKVGIVCLNAVKYKNK